MNRVEEQSVSAILEAMHGMGIEVKGNVRELAGEIAKRMNDKITFEPSHPSKWIFFFLVEVAFLQCTL